MEEKRCIECKSILPEEYDSEKCDECLKKEVSQKKNKSFWEEVEKNQTTIEDFGYTVNTEIRKSENCVVYKATTPENKTVTIKKISIPVNNTEGTISIKEKIASEIEQLSKISNGADNRFVITYYDYKIESNDDEGKYDLYIKMEYLTSLSKYYIDNAISVRNILKLGLDVCKALEWCHNNGKLHNNINPENIFVNNNGNFVLGDFALSYVGQNEEPVCIAPENVNGEDTSTMSDIYALGMVMYLMLNDREKPFYSETNDAQIAEMKRVSGEVLPFKNGISNRLKDVIIKATSNKNERYASVSDFRRDIEYLLEEMPAEWLDCDINKSATIDKEAEKKEKKEKKTKPEKIDLKEFDEKQELQPEEKEKKQREKKDLIIIGVIIVAIIAIVASVVLVFNNSGNRKLYSLIDSGSYAVAYKEIDDIHSQGENVDELLKTYIEACMNDYEYKRVVQAIQIFSDEAFMDINYFSNILEEIINANKIKQANELIEILSGKSDAMDSMLTETINKYN